MKQNSILVPTIEAASKELDELTSADEELNLHSKSSRLQQLTIAENKKRKKPYYCKAFKYQLLKHALQFGAKTTAETFNMPLNRIQEWGTTTWNKKRKYQE